MVHSNLVLTCMWKESIGKLCYNRKWELFREDWQLRSLLTPTTLTLWERELRRRHRHCSEDVGSPCCTSNELPYLALQTFHASGSGPLACLITNHLSPHSLSGELCFLLCPGHLRLHNQPSSGWPRSSSACLSFQCVTAVGKVPVRDGGRPQEWRHSWFSGGRRCSCEIAVVWWLKWVQRMPPCKADMAGLPEQREMWDLWTGWSFCLRTGQPAWHWLWHSAMGSTGKPPAPECRNRVWCPFKKSQPEYMKTLPRTWSTSASIYTCHIMSGNAISMLSACCALKCILLNNRAYPRDDHDAV